MATTQIQETRGPLALVLAPYAGSVMQFRGALLRQLASRGYQVLVSVPNPTQALKQDLAAIGAKCVPSKLSRTGLNPVADVAFASEVRRLIHTTHPSVVIATGIKAILYGLPAAHAASIPIRVAFFAGLGSTLRPTSWMQRLLGLVLQPLMRRALRASTHIVTQNPDDTNELRRRYHRCLASDPITTEGSGVDLAYFELAPVASSRVVLMMARIVPEKGIREFLSAARLVRQGDSSIRFTLAGFFESGLRGVRQDQFHAECAECGVEYLGNASDVRPLLRSCSVFVLPTYYGEGRPRSIQEALAMGRPVVTTDSVGCHDAIENGVHGYIVPARDHAALALAIQQVLKHPNPVELSKGCRALAETRYCSTTIACRWLDLIGLDSRKTSS